MELSWDTPVRFFVGNGDQGFRTTFRGCLAVFEGIAPDDRFTAFAEFEGPVTVGGNRTAIELGATELETAAALLRNPTHIC